MIIKTQIQINPIYQQRLDEMKFKELQTEQSRLYHNIFKTPEEHNWAEEVSGELAYRESLTRT